MESVQWGDVAAWAGVVIAVALAIWSRIGSGRAARDAKVAQDRSTKALEVAAAAQDRLASLAEAEATRYQMPWRIEPAGQFKFLLVNTGDDVEYDVSIEGEAVREGVVVQKRVGPREAVDFFAALTGGVTDSSVTVRWFRNPGQGGDCQEWRYPLTF